MKYKLIIFDMDGTILNTLEDLTDSTNFALKENGFPIRDIQEIRRFVGNGIAKLIERAVPEGTSLEIVNKVLEDFTKHYKSHCADKTAPYEGIISLINELKKGDYQVAVVSNKADFAVQELCKQYFPNLFDMAVGERVGVQKKPAPDMVNQVLQEMNIQREQSIYIGDSEVDVQTAQNAKMDMIAVTWGFRDKEELLSRGVTKCADTPEEVWKLLID